MLTSSLLRLPFSGPRSLKAIAVPATRLCRELAACYVEPSAKRNSAACTPINTTLSRYRLLHWYDWPTPCAALDINLLRLPLPPTYEPMRVGQTVGLQICVPYLAGAGPSATACFHPRFWIL